jgi:hypothetical protein
VVVEGMMMMMVVVVVVEDHRSLALRMLLGNMFF